MTRSKLISLSVLSGFLLIPAWSMIGTGLLLLFALIPLLFVEDYFQENKHEHRSYKVFLYSYLTFLIWNIGTTFWLLNATLFGILAITINSLLMSIIFWLFHITHRNTNSVVGYIALIAFWLVFEHFYTHGEISWPWLNLGNGFAKDIYLIQWYEFTGSFGGTFWVLLTNVLGYNILKRYFRQGNLKGMLPGAGILLSVILLPIIISLIIYSTYNEKNDPREIVVLQPNIDPYLEKFGGMEMSQQMDILLELADSLTTLETDYIVAPETFIHDDIWERDLPTDPSINRISDYLLNNYCQAAFIVGLHYQKLYPSTDDKSKTAQEVPGTGTYFDSYNAAIQIDTSGILQIYNKSKLVFAVESMPYVEYLGFLRKFTIRLGGTLRSHVAQDRRENFYNCNDSTGISPVICYESIYGEYLTDYIKLGSDFIFVITNDGWWGNTPGYRQHHSYARLRAIETRRSVVHSANTGISSLINQRGDIIQRTNYWERAAIRGSLNANDKLTFYTRRGDYISTIAYLLSLLNILYTGRRIIIRKMPHLFGA
ncbi:MAG TPA: apolipoprotein N-acyltransferase [Bacteroides sp.]|nr:apolipoprotein N-acyltransferase [Bacteroides sp.]